MVVPSGGCIEHTPLILHILWHKKVFLRISQFEITTKEWIIVLLSISLSLSRNLGKLVYARWKIYILVLSLNWEDFAFSSLAFKSVGLSKNLTKAGSFNRDARICSNANDHWGSSLWEEGSFSTGLSVFPWLGPLEAQSVAEKLLADDVGLCSFLPTSSILSKRLVTTAMAWYNDSSSGSSWNKL